MAQPQRLCLPETIYYLKGDLAKVWRVTLAARSRLQNLASGRFAQGIVRFPFSAP